MKITKNFILREIAGDFIIVPVGETAVEFNGMITLNETGAFLWNHLEEETDEASLTAALLEEYEVTKEEAAQDVKDFLELLRKHGIM